MPKYELLDEGYSGKAARKTFGQFNKLLEDQETAAKLRGTLGRLAANDRSVVDEEDRAMRRVVNRVLTTTDNGRRIGGSEDMWDRVFRSRMHNALAYSSESGLEPADIHRRHRKIGLQTLDVVAWLNTAEGKESTEPRRELVTTA